MNGWLRNVCGRDREVHQIMSGSLARFAWPLIQMRCSTDPDDNVRRACAMLRDAAATGRAGGVSAGAVPDPVLLPDRGPGPVRPGRADPGADDRGPGRGGPRDGDGRRRLDLREAARRASITTRRWCSTPTARSAAAIARCTSPTTRSTTRSTTSRPATSASRPFRPAFGRVGHAGLLGPVVSRSRPADGPARGRRSSSIPRRSAGIRPRRPSSARPRTSAWETMQRCPCHRQRRLRRAP